MRPELRDWLTRPLLGSERRSRVPALYATLVPFALSAHLPKQVDSETCPGSQLFNCQLQVLDCARRGGFQPQHCSDAFRRLWGLLLPCQRRRGADEGIEACRTGCHPGNHHHRLLINLHCHCFIINNHMSVSNDITMMIFHLTRMFHRALESLSS